VRVRGRCQLQPHRQHPGRQRPLAAQMNFDSSAIRRQRERAATHESAVLGIKIGNGVSRVEIWPGIQEDGTAPDGICTFRDFRSLSRETRIICTLGGPLSERRTGGVLIRIRTLPKNGPRGGEPDGPGRDAERAGK
jgi:hypothetical protein